MNYFTAAIKYINPITVTQHSKPLPPKILPKHHLLLCDNPSQPKTTLRKYLGAEDLDNQ